MFVQRLERVMPFRRSDALRLGIAAIPLIVALSAVFALDIVPTGLGLQVGDIAQSTIRSPRTVQYDSSILTQQAQQAARDAVPPQYDYTAERAASIAAEQIAELERAIAPVDAAFNSNLADAARKLLLRNALSGLSDAARATLVSSSADRWTAVRDESVRVLEQLERPELRDTDLASVRGTLPTLFVGDLTAAERELGAELVEPHLVANSSYSAALTEQARDAAARATPVQSEQIQQGEVIVDEGHRITDLDLEKVAAVGLNDSRLDGARLFGWILLACLLVGLLWAWMWRFRPEMWHRNNVLLLIALVLTFVTFALKITAGRSILPFFLPTAAAGILVAILLDSGTAMVLTAVIAIVAGAVNGNSLEIASYVFLGGFAGIVAIRRGDRVHTFVQAGMAMAIANALVVTTFALLGERDVTGVLQLWGASAAAAGGSAIAAAGSFAVLGNLFGILTVFQLLELANPSQELLRRLLIETPGTYHHAIMVGNLAERAAEAIGADSLLARVAAYYHDVGKLASPMAFIENQGGGENPHDQLEPEVSAQVLKQHVADGIDIAYKARLPKSIIAFIPQHHGTAIMSYFYARARAQAAEPFGGLATAAGAKAAESVDARKYRHAGPKPQSREAAIIMLADGVEASVRSLSSRDEPAIRAMVERIIDERMSDGQFDECDLTLRDIQRIREAFVAQLLGMYHQRVEYPQNKIVEIESRRGGAAGVG